MKQDMVDADRGAEQGSEERPVRGAEAEERGDARAKQAPLWVLGRDFIRAATPLYHDGPSRVEGAGCPEVGRPREGFSGLITG